MRPALRRAIAGVGTYLGAYLLMAIATVPIRSRVLKATFPGAESVSDLWHVYEAAGQPVWKAVGLVLLNAHLVPLRIEAQPNVVTWKNPLVWTAGADWLYLVPAVACFAAGLAVVLLSEKSTPIPWAVGAYLAIGYVATAVASTFLVGITAGAATARPALLSRVSLAWPLAMVGYPLVFGSLGAFAAQTPLLEGFRSPNRDR